MRVLGGEERAGAQLILTLKSMVLVAPLAGPAALGRKPMRAAEETWARRHAPHSTTVLLVARLVRQREVLETLLAQVEASTLKQEFEEERVLF